MHLWHQSLQRIRHECQQWRRKALPRPPAARRTCSTRGWPWLAGGGRALQGTMWETWGAAGAGLWLGGTAGGPMWAATEVRASLEGAWARGGASRVARGGL